MNNPEERSLTFAAAIREGLTAAMSSNDKIVILGEDISLWGGRHNVTEGLVRQFGEDRVIDTPLVEDMVVGMGIGLALSGYHRIVELGYGAFLTLAIDDIYRAATWRFRYPGTSSMPLVVRVVVGGYDGRGQEFSADFRSWYQHIPGLTLVSPATPKDAKGLLSEALASGKPTAFLEDKMLYPVRGDVPNENYRIPIGIAHISKNGKDLTIIGCGYMVHLANAAAQQLADESIFAEIVDLRTLVPLDIETVMKSAEKTGRVLVIEHGIARGGIGAEIAMRIHEINRGIAVRRVGAANIPPAPLIWEHYTLPAVETIIAAAKDLVRQS